MFDSPPSAVNRLQRLGFTLGQFLANLVAPPVCVLCGDDGQAGFGLWGLDLCEHCEAACPPAPLACPRCAGQLAAGAAASAAGCPACRLQPPPWQLACAPLRYAWPVDHLVRELKFRHELPFGRVLGLLLARERGGLQGPLPEVVIPVPLHRERFAERGFNQSAEIARHAARALGLPLRAGALRRRRATAEQSQLGAAARSGNVRGAFAWHGPRRPWGSVALVDDVLTTGSTLAEAARTLRAAGVARVEVWAAARAPAEGPAGTAGP